MKNITQHAACRMQQRGIKSEAIEILCTWGAREYDHHGATVLYFDKSARQRARKEYGRDQYNRIEGQLDIYAVLANDGSIVTIGHRTKRINRH